MGWLDTQYAEMRHSLSQRKAWEIVTAIVLLVLAALSVVFCFLFTLVIPPGQDNSGSAAASNAQKIVPMLYRRAAVVPMADMDLRQKFASGAGINDAQFCIQIGRDIINDGGSPSDAASETMMCLGVVNVPQQDTLTRLEKDLSIALTTGNMPGAMKTLIKMIHFSIIDEGR